MKEWEECLRIGAPEPRRVRDLRRFLEDEVWPQVPPDVLGKPISRAERGAILGHGPQGV